MTKNLTFDNEMKSLSLGVYKDNKNSIPKDWVRFSERDNESTGFHAETFYKKGTVVISMRGTDPFSYQDIIFDTLWITAIQSYQDITIYKNRKIFINNKIQKS